MSQTNSNIKDVARRAGVSIATVSHVLNNTKHVSADTRERVLKAIEGLQYQPNHQARSLRMGQERNILVLAEEPCLSSMAASSLLTRFITELQKLHQHVITSFYTSIDQAAALLKQQNFSTAYVFLSHSIEGKRSLFGTDILFLNFGLEDCSVKVTDYDQLNLGYFFYSEIDRYLKNNSVSQIVMSYQQGKIFKHLFPDHANDRIHIMKSEVSSGSYYLKEALSTGSGHILFTDYTLFIGAVKYLLQNENVLYSCDLNIEYLPWSYQAETYGFPLGEVPLPLEELLKFVLEQAACS